VTKTLRNATLPDTQLFKCPLVAAKKAVPVQSVLAYKSTASVSKCVLHLCSSLQKRGPLTASTRANACGIVAEHSWLVGKAVEGLANISIAEDGVGHWVCGAACVGVFDADGDERALATLVAFGAGQSRSREEGCEDGEGKHFEDLVVRV
jgi:hypothetical protein